MRAQVKAAEPKPFVGTVESGEGGRLLNRKDTARRITAQLLAFRVDGNDCKVARTMATFAFYSGALLNVAHRAASKAEEDPNQALVAVVFAAAALEAMVNECLDWIQAPETKRDLTLDRLLAIAVAADLYGRSATVSRKLQIISATLASRTIDEGTQPYQDFYLLLRLRNALLHQRMERLPDEEEPAEQPNKVIEALRQLGLGPSGEASGNISVMGIASQPRVARWAVNTSLAMGVAVIELFPAHFKKLLGWGFTRIAPFKPEKS